MRGSRTAMFVRLEHCVYKIDVGPFGYLSVIVGLSMDGRLISKSTTLAPLSHELTRKSVSVPKQQRRPTAPMGQQS